MSECLRGFDKDCMMSYAYNKIVTNKKLIERDYQIVKIQQQNNSMTLVECILKEMYFFENI